MNMVGIQAGLDLLLKVWSTDQQRAYQKFTVTGDAPDSLSERLHVSRFPVIYVHGRI